VTRVLDERDKLFGGTSAPRVFIAKDPYVHGP
jgi:hypothetical protein